MKYFNLKCPYCNADLDDYDGLDTFYCKYCGGKVILEEQDKEVLRAKIREKDSKRVLHEKDKDLEREFLRKEKEFEHQKKIDKYKNRIWNSTFRNFIIWLLIIIIAFSFLELYDYIFEKRSASLYMEIQQLVENGQYDEALALLPRLCGSDEWNEKHDIIELRIKQAYIDKMDNKYITIGKSASSFKRTNYKDVVTFLKNMGFIYVNTFTTSSSNYWFPHDDEVEEISIDGINDFKPEAEFPLDAKITITYYKRDK